MKKVAKKKLKLKPSVSFEQWYSTVPAERNDTTTYDLRRAFAGLPYKDMVKFSKKGEHLPDTYKTPMHPTFSLEADHPDSKTKGGMWTNNEGAWQYQPSLHNIETLGGPDAYKRWWGDNEPNATLVMPADKSSLPRYKMGAAQATAIAGGIGSVGGFVSGIGDLALASGDTPDSSGYMAGATMSGIGKGLSSGAALGASIGSIVPGAGTAIGAGIGAVAGGVAGLFTGRAAARNAAKQYRIGKRVDVANRAISGYVDMNNNIATNANMDLNRDFSVAGYKNGTPMFSNTFNSSVNALISNKEGVKDPDTGILSVVPGEYDSSNPDKVAASLKQGTSIYSADPKNKLPFGSSTPAAIIGKMEGVQKKSILNLRRGGFGDIDKNTAKINLANIEKQTGLLDMNTTLENIKRNGTIDGNKYSPKLPKYNDGNPPLTQEELSKRRAKIWGNVGNAVGDLGRSMSSFAPIVYNLRNSSPEVESPVYHNYINPSMRTDVSPMLNESRRQRQIARYNQRSMSPDTGSNMALGASIYSAGMDNVNNIYSQAQVQNNVYRKQEADTYNRYAEANTAEERRVNDVNARNRAAARGMKAQALTQLSDWAQNSTLEKNTKRAESAKAIMAYMYGMNSLSPEQRANILKMLDGLGVDISGLEGTGLTGGDATVVGTPEETYSGATATNTPAAPNMYSGSSKFNDFDWKWSMPSLAKPNQSGSTDKWKWSMPSFTNNKKKYSI